VIRCDGTRGEVLRESSVVTRLEVGGWRLEVGVKNWTFCYAAEDCSLASNKKNTNSI